MRVLRLSPELSVQPPDPDGDPTPEGWGAGSSRRLDLYVVSSDRGDLADVQEKPLREMSQAWTGWVSVTVAVAQTGVEPVGDTGRSPGCSGEGRAGVNMSCWPAGFQIWA